MTEFPTARAQRWDPAELARVLLAEEAAGRDAEMLAARRKKAGFPAGKTFDVWDEKKSSIPMATQSALRSLEWVTRRENFCVVGPSGTGKSHWCEALGHAVVEAGMTTCWFTIEDLGVLVRRHRADDSMTKAMQKIMRADLVIVDDIGSCPSPWMPPRGSTAWSTPPTRNAPSPSAATFIRPVLRRSCQRPSPPRPSTGCFTMLMSWSPRVIRSGSPRPPPARR